ncbi:surfeit locus protein 2 [Archocentrus centrarchus]|uniref:surfeit locus protein 2 n=1 Tax=Archocentrus centrarchus TaxID=63155 RepID=UPI0011E9FC98|nr:surfeit locus protein 2 [Archocentrus centrarchus]
MDELPADLRAFLLNHPFLELTDGKKIRCTLNGHEFPCNLTELQNFTQGKKYEKLSAAAEFNYSQYEPHIVPSTKQPNQLFCKLTLRHLNRQPHHVLKHVNGKRFKKALSKYEECVRQGIEFVPARLTQKRPRDTEEVGRGKPSRHSNSAWEPSSSEDDHSDSEDSMSDLYPPSIFTLKNPAEESIEDGRDEEEDDFQTDEDEEMEVEKQVVQKRKKVQSGGFNKKPKNNNWRSSKAKKKKTKARNGK